MTMENPVPSDEIRSPFAHMDSVQPFASIISHSIRTRSQ